MLVALLAAILVHAYFILGVRIEPLHQGQPGKKRVSITLVPRAAPPAQAPSAVTAEPTPEAKSAPTPPNEVKKAESPPRINESVPVPHRQKPEQPSSKKQPGQELPMPQLEAEGPPARPLSSRNEASDAEKAHSGTDRKPGKVIRKDLNDRPGAIFVGPPKPKAAQASRKMADSAFVGPPKPAAIAPKKPRNQKQAETREQVQKRGESSAVVSPPPVAPVRPPTAVKSPQPARPISPEPPRPSIAARPYRDHPGLNVSDDDDEESDDESEDEDRKDAVAMPQIKLPVTPGKKGDVIIGEPPPHPQVSGLFPPNETQPIRRTEPEKITASPEARPADAASVKAVPPPVRPSDEVTGPSGNPKARAGKSHHVKEPSGAKAAKRTPSLNAGLLSQQIAQMGEEMARQRSDEMRRTKIIYASEMKSNRAVVAAYEQAWQEKVERIGNLNFPDQARREKLTGKLVLAVAIKPDGSIYSIQVQQSSSHPTLDDAARKIVMLAAPFAPLPKEILSDVDVLVITRAWLFDSQYHFETRAR